MAYRIGYLERFIIMVRKEQIKRNIPNTLSIFRFIVTIVIVVLMTIPNSTSYIGNSGISVIDLTCCILFIVGSLSDMLDGQIARRCNLVSNFGKFIDPLADKALVNSSLIMLAVTKSSLVPGIIVVLMILRDLAVDGVRFLAASKGEVIAANIYGKLKTVAQMIAIPFLFLNGWPFNYLAKENTYIVTIILICIPLVLSYISGIIYIYRGRKYIVNEKKEEESK